MGYGVNLIPVPAPVVPVIEIGGAVDMAEFSVVAKGTKAGTTPGDFDANGLAGTLRGRAGLEFFLGTEYTLGIYACGQIGRRTTLYVSNAKDAVLDATMLLPTAGSFAANPSTPSAWNDLTYLPGEIAFYACLRYNFRLSRAPGVVEP
jgi:hypothetical protein